MEDCKGLIGKLFGHKYVQMGNKKFVKTDWIHERDSMDGFAGSYYIPVKKDFYNFEYVHSQCVRCGNIVKENSDGSNLIRSKYE